MYKHILVATDGSALSEKMLAPAVALARALRARITGVHVYPANLPVFTGEAAWIDQRLQDRLREAAMEDGNRYLDRVEQAAGAAGVACERALVAADHVWRGIIDTAQARGCDLIVMAAHGRRGAAAVLLGSETNRVLVHSTIPVLVYR